MTKFKTGDTAIALRSTLGITAGREYEVTKVLTGVNGQERIVFIDNDGDARYRDAVGYELKPKAKFKVGDKVKIINPDYDEAEYPGIHTDTFTVAEARDDSHTYPYILSPKPNGVIMNVWTDEELKLTKETDMTEFKIGTRVEITHDFHDAQLAAGTKGTVKAERQVRGIGEVCVLLDNGRGHNFYAHELKQIEKTIDDIQVGDTVIYNGGWADHEHRVGARMGEVVILLGGDGHVDSTYSIQELKDSGNFSLPKVEEPEVELTVAQIAEKLGHKVKVVEG